jgi:hypothetical protein
MHWIRERRRAKRKTARYAEMATLVLEARELTVAALGAASNPEVIGHLLTAVSSIDRALKVLAPAQEPGLIFAVPTTNDAVQ